MMLDLTHVPVVDNHCHAVQARSWEDLEEWRSVFTESDNPLGQRRFVADTVAYRRLLVELGEYLQVDADETSVFAARAGLSTDELTSGLWESAGFAALLLDDGFPGPPLYSVAEHAAFAGAAGFTVHRVEHDMERLIFHTELDLDGICAELQRMVRDAVGGGAVALKTAIAYRSGLAVRRWPEPEAEGELHRLREAARAGGPSRLDNAVVHDSLLHAALESAAELALPVQFHVGYGDSDVDMRVGGPEHLRPLLEDSRYADVQFVLLHECYPFTAIGAWLAAVYDNVWLDLSYAIPLLSAREMKAFTQTALAVAPWSKLMVSSDAIKIPELHWSGARMSRTVLARSLQDLVDDGDLMRVDAEAAGARVLNGTATELYGLA